MKSMYALLAQTMKEAGADGGELRFILHTHSHHDHMGCMRISRTAPAAIAAPTLCCLARRLRAPLPGVRVSISAPGARHAYPPSRSAGHPRCRWPLDLFVQEGVQFNLGGGVSLWPISFPGHLLAELAGSRRPLGR